jgi:NADH-quinone oxidoreductase subunit B
MSANTDQTTSNGRPTTVPQKSDRYIFGTLDSFGKNQEKLREVSWGYDQPEGIVLASMDAAINGMADDLWSGVLCDRDDVDGRVAV